MHDTPPPRQRMVILAKGLAAKGTAPGQPSLFGTTTVRPHVRKTATGKVSTVKRHSRIVKTRQAEEPANVFRMKAAELRELVDGDHEGNAALARDELARRAAKRAKKKGRGKKGATKMVMKKPSREASPEPAPSAPTRPPTEGTRTYQVPKESFQTWLRRKGITDAGSENDEAELLGAAFGSGNKGRTRRTVGQLRSLRERVARRKAYEEQWRGETEWITKERALRPDSAADRALVRTRAKRAARRAKRAAEEAAPAAQATWPPKPKRFANKYTKAEVQQIGRDLATHSSLGAVHDQAVAWHNHMKVKGNAAYNATWKHYTTSNPVTLATAINRRIQGFWETLYQSQSPGPFYDPDMRKVENIQAFLATRVAPVTAAYRHDLAFWKNPVLWEPDTTAERIVELAHEHVSRLPPGHGLDPEHLKRLLVHKGVPARALNDGQSGWDRDAVHVSELVRGKTSLAEAIARHDKKERRYAAEQRLGDSSEKHAKLALLDVYNELDDAGLLTTHAPNILKRLPAGVEIDYWRSTRGWEMVVKGLSKRRHITGPAAATKEEARAAFETWVRDETANLT